MVTASGTTQATITSWQSGPPYSEGKIEVGASGAYNGILYYIGGQIHPGGAYTNGVYFSSIHLVNTLGPWTKSPHPYPGAKGIWALQCPPYNGFVYCIGGNQVPGGTTNSVYFASITSSGLGPWQTTSTYPIHIRFESCVPVSGFMYCVGGSPSGNKATRAVYFAPILGHGGLGTWSSTTAYPVSAWTHCVAYLGYLFCETDYNGTAITNVTYYASISSAGVETWHKGPDYPIAMEKMQCVQITGVMYCVGGGNGLGGLDGNRAVDSVYSIVISPAGFSGWVRQTNYPIPVKDHACSAYNTYIYCIGGDDPQATNAVYFAQMD